MANKIYQQAETAIVIADTTDYAGDIGSRTDQIDLTLLGDGAARQSDKVDLGKASVHLGLRFDLFVAIEYDVAPADDMWLDVHIAFSPSATAATANPGGVAGADGAYTGTAGSTMDESLEQLEHIGALRCTNDAATVVQFQHIGSFLAVQRYATFVVDNNGGQALEGDANEMGLLIVPQVLEAQ